MEVERGQRQHEGRSPKAPARQNALLLLALEAGDEHLLGPLGSLQVVLQHGIDELNELLSPSASASWM